MIEKNEVQKEIKGIIDSFFVENPKYSLARLAKESKVNYNPLYKGYSGHSIPDPVNILRLLKFVKKKNDINDIIDNAPKNLKKVMLKDFSILYNAGKHKIIDHEEVLHDFDKYVIFSLAANRNGIDKKKLIRRLGTLIERKINELIDQKLISEEKNGILKVNFENCSHASFSLKFCQNQISNYARFYAADEGDNYIHQISEGLNKKGYKQAMELHKEFHERMVKLINDEDNKGDIPFFSVSFMDMFIREEEENA